MATSKVRIPLFKVDIAYHAASDVADVLASGYIGEGPKTKAFEDQLTILNRQPTVVVNSGTSALWLSYYVAGFRAGDYVICTAQTCSATCMPLSLMGIHILWADVDPMTGMLDPMSVLTLIGKYGAKVKGVVHVDWGGDVGPLETLSKICSQFGIPLIEDAAHTFDSYRNEPGDCVGLASMRSFSYQAIKSLSSGDGGSISVQSEEVAARLRLLRWFGLDRTKGASMRCYQNVTEAGFKMQMNDIAAAIGLAQLPDIPRRVEKARQNAVVYDQMFRGSDIIPLLRYPGSSCWLYSIRVPNARDFIAKMEELNIECSQVHSRIDTQINAFGPQQGPLPGMDILERELVCIPVGHWVSTEDVVYIAQAALKSVVG